jgi:hypothetical protein
MSRVNENRRTIVEHRHGSLAAGTEAACIARHEWLAPDGRDHSIEIWRWDGLFWLLMPDGVLGAPSGNLEGLLERCAFGRLSNDGSHDIRFWDVGAESALKFLVRTQRAVLAGGGLCGSRSVDFIFNGRLAHWYPDGCIRVETPGKA